MVRIPTGHTVWIIAGLKNYSFKVGKKYENHSGLKSFHFTKVWTCAFEVRWISEISREENLKKIEMVDFFHIASNFHNTDVLT